MVIPASIKRLLWRGYQYTGPLQALALRCSLIRRHGLVAGNVRYRRLPPGGLEPVDERLRVDQRYLLKRAERLGPIFKNKLRRVLLISVVGNETARRIVSAGEPWLLSRHKDLSALFPVGHLRSMHGDTHRHYRALFVRAMRPEIFAACEAELQTMAADSLAELSAEPSPGGVSTGAVVESLRDLATRMLLRVLLGIGPADPASGKLVAAYARLASGYAPAYTYAGHSDAYEEIRGVVVERTRGASAERAPDCVLKRLLAGETLDDTTIGNLIYMVESGRFDLFSLFRWILHYLTLTPELTARIRCPSGPGDSAGVGVATACVLETLRSNQSEAIQRTLTHDLEFEGLFFPAGSQLRFCLWEAHKDADTFPEPFRFEPQRFLRRSYPLNQFAPFGLDKHRCVASDIVVALGAIFVAALARYDLEAVSDGEPVWGAYHWEPAPAFAVRLRPADRAQHSAGSER